MRGVDNSYMLGSIVLPKNKEVMLSAKKDEKNDGEEKETHGIFDSIEPKDYAKKIKNKRNPNKQEKAEFGKETQKEGEKEAHKEIVKETEKQQEILEDVIEKSKKVLLKSKSVFPFDWFPDELIIDPTKVIIVHREFLSSGAMDTVYIKDIADVIVETGPYLATLNIIDVSYGANKHYISKLKKADALRAREIIEGLVTALKAGIDILKLPGENILSSISQLSGMQKIASP